MSATAPSDEREPPVVAEPEGVRARAVATIGGIAIVIVAAAVFVSSIVLRSGGLDMRPRATNGDAPPRPAPVTIGVVEQSLVDDNARGVALRARQRAALGRYAWVDADAGVVAIPIDRAIDIVVTAHARDAGGDAP